MTDESVNPVLNALDEYEYNHKSLLFSRNDARDVAVNLIYVIAAIQDPKNHVYAKIQQYGYKESRKYTMLIFLRTLVKKLLQLTQHKTTEIPLKHDL